MGKLKKTYRVENVRVDVFENMNKNKTKYFIFKLWLYDKKMQIPMCLNRKQMNSLKKICEKIEFAKKYEETDVHKKKG